MGVPYRRVTELVGTVGGVGALFLVGLVSGVDIWTVSTDLLPRPLVFFEGSVSITIFSVVVFVTGVFVLRSVWFGETDAVFSGPEVRAVVPAYRDHDVVAVSVDSLTETEYENLSVTVVTEPDDTKTQMKARELAEEYDDVEHLINGNSGSKGDAINYAVERSDTEYFAVFDADEEISPEFIPSAMGNLVDGADVFQGRRVPRAKGTVETLAYCERLIVHMGYAFGEIFGFTNCLSASTVFTREAFEEVGGYEDNLTEDIEFAHACNRSGLSVTHDRSVTNTMESPHTFRDFWGQRKRWRIGHVQVFQSRLTEAVKGELTIDDLSAIGRASGAIVGGAFLIVVMAQMLSLTLQGAFFVVSVPFALFFAVLGLVWAKDALTGRIAHPSWVIVFAPLIFFIHGALTVKSMMEYYLTWEGEWYQVTKTGS